MSTWLASPQGKELSYFWCPKRIRVSYLIFNHRPPQLEHSCAHSAGCTTQACGFRDIYPDFASLNFDVYCLSADAPAAQSKWQTKVHSLTKNAHTDLKDSPRRKNSHIRFYLTQVVSSLVPWVPEKAARRKGVISFLKKEANSSTRRFLSSLLTGESSNTRSCFL
jgi:hypothetical protein